MYNLYADADFGVGGLSKPLKTASVDTDEQISNRFTFFVAVFLFFRGGGVCGLCCFCYGC